MRQNQGIGQSVGDVKRPTDRISQRVHSHDGRIDKSLTRQHGPNQHGASCRRVLALNNGRFDVAPNNCNAWRALRR
jgi:hypothetical protein